MPEIHIYSMSTGVYEEAGKCLPVSYSMVETPKGQAFFAESCGRIIHLFLTQDEHIGMEDFKRRWNMAKPTHRPEHCQKMIDEAYASMESSNSIRLLVLGTEFQIRVWEALVHIPAGTVTTYKEIAESIGQPDSIRAVANAIGENPVAHLIPCHRVVRTDGSLGGYRWGLESKRTFLADEGFDLNQLSAA